jgi:hypothetical protein
MKKLLTILILMFSVTLFAEYRTNWEKPIMGDKALKVLNSSGIFLDYEDFGLTLNQRESSKSPTSITLLLSVDGELEEYLLTIDSSVDGTCGSLQYQTEASEKTSLYITLTDNTNRHCDDYRGFQWEVIIESGKSQVELLGSPKRMITIY